MIRAYQSILVFALASWCIAAQPTAAIQVPDLTPVTILPAPTHDPVQIVKGGAAIAKVYVVDPKPSATLQMLLEEFQTSMKLSTGAQLEMVAALPPAETPVIIIGDCEESRKAGIDAAKIPIEGFVIKTAPNRVYLVGSTVALPSNIGTAYQYANEGTAWAVADFLERFVQVRWYWPVQVGGRSIVKTADLAIAPVHYTDAPVFRKRVHHPPKLYKVWKSRAYEKEQPDPPALAKDLKQLDLQPLLTCLRGGSSWPYQVKVHQPQGMKSRYSQQWRKDHAAIFALKPDGTRSDEMLCYSSQATFDFLIDGCVAMWDKKTKGRPPWMTEACISISPSDEPIRCQCPECRKLYDEKSPRYGAASGQASKIMGRFVSKVCEEVKRRWPEKKVIYLPYWNYSLCPADVDFPGNLQIEMCTTAFGGLRDVPVRKGIEENLRAWSKKVGGRVTTWEYSCRVLDWTHAPTQFPHLVQDYYRANREVLAGSFINGRTATEWSKAAPTMYCWMKVLWNPDVDVDAILDGMCNRMFGNGAKTSRQFLRLMCDRWEKAPWSEPLGASGYISTPIFCETWPPAVVEEMKKLHQQARDDMKGDPEALARFDYWNWTFGAFLKEAEKQQMTKDNAH